MRIVSRPGARVCAGILCAFLLLLGGQPVVAKVERRVALVIGNAAYEVAPRLVNPTTDAKSVAAAFRRLGFEVVDGYDLSIREMRAKIAEFASAIPGSEAALVYYAGHGVSVDDENYLLPTDITLKSPTDLDLYAISLSLVLRQMKRDERINIVILDACRDNPFATDLARASMRAVIADRGLSRVESDLAKGTLLAFASDPKSTALDGDPGANSPFTKALLNHLEDEGVSIGTVMDRVRAEVWRETKTKQLPWVSTSIIGEFVLNPKAPTAKPAPVAAVSRLHESRPAEGPDEQERAAPETRLWDFAERGDTIAEYEAYLAAYPNGAFAAMAKARIARLGVAQKPALTTGADAAASADAPKAVSPPRAKRKEAQKQLARETAETEPQPTRPARAARRQTAAPAEKIVERAAKRRPAQAGTTRPVKAAGSYASGAGGVPGRGPNPHPAGPHGGHDPAAAAFFGGLMGGAISGIFRRGH